jgi:hypothetical protein
VASRAAVGCAADTTTDTVQRAPAASVTPSTDTVGSPGRASAGSAGAALAFGGIRDAAEALDVAIQSFDPLAPRRDGFAALAGAEIAADRGSPCHWQMAQQQGQP